MAEQTPSSRRFAALLNVRHVKAPEGLPWTKNKHPTSDHDIKNLKAVLKRNGFECEVKKGFESKLHLENYLRDLSGRDFSQYGIVLVFITGYGAKDSCIWCPDGKLCSLRKLIDSIFSGCHLSAEARQSPRFSALVRAYKLFFIQACDYLKYPMLQPIATDGDTSEEEDSDTKPVAVSSNSNISIFWSAIPGQLDWRKSEEGSMSVEHFCNVLSESADGSTLEEMFTKVLKAMSEELNAKSPAPVNDLPTWQSTALQHASISNQ